MNRELPFPCTAAGRAIAGARECGVGLLAAAVALLALACGSTTETMTSPTASRCGLQADIPGDAFAASGGSGTLRITTSRECAWTARTDASWLTFSSSASGQGDGSVQFAVAANSEPATRRGAISVNDVRIDVAQAGRPCDFDVASDRETVGADGGERSVRVNTSGTQCAWTASSGVSWITMLTTTGSGSADARFSVSPSSVARTATITVAGRTIVVTQTPECAVSVSPSTFDAPVSGGPGSISVSAGASCTWTTTTSTPWIAIGSGARGTGPGEVRFMVAASAGPPRTGAIRVGDQEITVTQGYSCTFTITPDSLAVPASGGTGSLQMQTQAGCDWTSAANAPWIVVQSGARGSGDGRIVLQVAANNGPSRTGTVTIAARAIAVVQQDGCTFTLDRDRQSFPAGGGSGAVSVGGLAACAWTATAGASWISITNGGAGTGNGQVQFTVAANTGPARQASLVVGGSTFVVQQASGCAYRVEPSGLTLPGTGGAGSVGVTTETGCPWTTTADVEWLTSSPSSGAGSAQLQIVAAPNLSPARTGALAVAGQPVTVVQPSQCTYGFSPPTHAFGPDGGAGNLLIIVSGPCTWTAVSAADWITITAGASGTGGGLIQFLAAPNPGPARTGIIRIAGQDYLVTEGAAERPGGVTLDRPIRSELR